MATSITQAFITQFGAETKLAYQQMSPALRAIGRTVNGVVGSTYRFQKLGSGVASQKARHGNIPPMNLSHSYVDVTLQDWYAAEYIDDLDRFKTNIELRTSYLRTAMAALARKSDEMDIVALDAGALGTLSTTTGGLTWDKIREAAYQMDILNVPSDNRWFIIGPEQKADLFEIADANSNSIYVSRDFIDGNVVMTANVESRPFYGFRWVVSTLLPLSGNVRTCFAVHGDAFGRAIGADVSSELAWVPEKDAFFVKTKLSQNAVVIDSAGVIAIDCEETFVPL